MNKVLKRILLGLLIWVVPFLVSVLIWDTENGGPKVSLAWFYSIMAVSGAIALAISLCIYFKTLKKSEAVREGWLTGFTW